MARLLVLLLACLALSAAAGPRVSQILAQAHVTGPTTPSGETARLRSPDLQDATSWPGPHESRPRRLAGSDAAPSVVRVPWGSLRLQARPRTGMQLRRRSLFWVDLWVSDRFVRSVPVSLGVSGAARLGPEMVLPGQDEDPSEARHADATAGRLAVQRGAAASLRTITGAVQLDSRVQVLDDGRVGDLVRVRQHGASTPLSARVTGPGQLEVAR